MKKKYETVEIEIITFDEDVLMGSPDSVDGTGGIPDGWDGLFN